MRATAAEPAGPRPASLGLLHLAYGPCGGWRLQWDNPDFRMSTTYFDTPADKKTISNPLGLKGVDHIEFIVDNADQWRDFFVTKYGMSRRFYADANSGVIGRRAHVVGQGRINFLVAEP